MVYLIGGDLGGTNLRTVVASREGILLKVKDNARKEGDSTTIPRQFFQQIVVALKELNIKLQDVQGIGLSTCGPFENEGRDIVAPNLCGGIANNGMIPNKWLSIPMKDYLEDRLRRESAETIFEMGNDCVTAVVAESMFGAAQDVLNVLYVTWSTGIGTGAKCTFRDSLTGQVMSGILLGHNDNAPHGGHVMPGFPIEFMFSGFKDYICGCGQKADLEAIARGDIITALARHEMSNNDQQRYSLLWEYCGGELKRLETQHVFRAAKQSDPTAQKVADFAIEQFAKGLITYINMLCPRVIVLGGSVMKDRDYIMSRLNNYIQNYSFKALSREVELRYTGLGEFLGDIAGLCLVMPPEFQQNYRATEPWKREIREINLKSS